MSSNNSQRYPNGRYHGHNSTSQRDPAPNDALAPSIVTSRTYRGSPIVNHGDIRYPKNPYNNSVNSGSTTVEGRSGQGSLYIGSVNSAGVPYQQQPVNDNVYSNLHRNIPVSYQYGQATQQSSAATYNTSGPNQMPPIYDRSSFAPSSSTSRGQANNVDKDSREDQLYLHGDVTSGAGSQFDGYTNPMNGNGFGYIGASGSRKQPRGCGGKQSK